MGYALEQSNGDAAAGWDFDVRRAAGGDSEAYARLVERTRGLVSSIALSLLRDVHASEDVAQEVYLAVWRDLPGLRRPDSFLPWLRQLTRNRAHDQLRARRPTGDERSLAAFADPRPDSSEQLASAQERAALLSAFEELSAEAREVMTLFYREDRSVAQVSALLGLSEGAVKKRLQRAREALREELMEQLGEVLARSTPGAAFTALVMGAVTSVSKTASAAALAQAGKLGSLAAKPALALSGSLVGGLLGSLGVMQGLRTPMRRARDAEERRALTRFGRVNVAIALLGSLGMGLGEWRFPGGSALALAFAAMWLGITGSYLLWLPRIIARREALERSEDPQAAARQRREHRLGHAAMALGSLAGWGTLVWALYKIRH